MDFGRNAEVNLLLNLDRHYSGRRADIYLKWNLGSCRNCDVISSPILEYFSISRLFSDVLLTSKV